MGNARSKGSLADSRWRNPEFASRLAGKDGWRIIESDIKEDLTAGKGLPKWIFTSYGPHRSSPASLLPDNEMSPEELRLRFYDNAAATNPEQANNEAVQAYMKCEADIKEILNNLGRVRTHHEQKEKEHPNRHDLSNADTVDGRKTIVQVTEELKAGNSGFRQPTGTFGQRSQANTGFGKPAFGQSNASSGFGQSGFGQPNFGQSPFGKPTFGSSAQPTTGVGQANQAAFGQPSQTGFGQPGQSNTPFGQSAQSANPFSQSNQSTANQSTGAFGNPSTSGFGQSSFGNPAFGQPGQPNTGFGKPAFGQQQTAFGQTTNPPTAPPFGSSTQPTTSGFGKPSFGQPTSTGGFGQSSTAGTAFGQPPTSNAPPVSNPFGQQSQPASSSGFGQQASVTTAKPTSTVVSSTITAPSLSAQVGKPSTAPPHPLTGAPPAIIHPSQSLPPITPQNTTYTTTGPSNRRLTKWRGRPVKYDEDDKPCYERADGKGLERIWFPEGKDTPGEKIIKREETEGPPEAYTDEVVGAYEYLFRNGEFDPRKKVPQVPPKREWLTADF